MVDDNGQYTDLPASGQRVHVHGIAVDVCRGGRIVDHAAYYDENSIRKQISISHQGRSPDGALPSCAPTAVKVQAFLLAGQAGRVSLLLHTAQGVVGRDGQVA